MSFRGGTLISATLAFLLLGLGIAGIVTTRMSLNSLNLRNNYNTVTVYDYRQNATDPRLIGQGFPVPPGTHRGGLVASLAASGIAVVVGVALLVSEWTARRKTSTPANHALVSLVCSIPAAVAALVAFIYSMVQYYTSDPAGVDAFLSLTEEDAYAMNFQGRLTNALGASGTYTWESWTCQTADMWYRITLFDLGYYRACDIAKTSRWLMLPLCIFSWALLGFFAYLWWRTSRKDLVARRDTKDSVELSPGNSRS